MSLGIKSSHYVDNLLLTGPDINLIDHFKKELGQTFQMTNLGPCRYYLGMRITQDQKLGIICLDQTKYIKSILQTFQVTNSKPVAIPMEEGLFLPPFDVTRLGLV